jgi:hypothetical protein
MASGILKYKAAVVTLWSVRTNEGIIQKRKEVVATRANASSTTSNVEVVTEMTSKMSVFSGNHGDDWTIWEMKFLAHLMKKGLDASLDPDFETRLPNKESEPFDRQKESERGC